MPEMVVGREGFRGDYSAGNRVCICVCLCVYVRVVSVGKGGLGEASVMAVVVACYFSRTSLCTLALAMLGIYCKYFYIHRAYNLTRK